MTQIVGIDTGGTFTDLVAYDSGQGSLVYSKSPSDAADLAGGAVHCMEQARIKPADLDLIKHGTTQVINAFIERAGARTALITTRGFRDLLEITRGNRPIAFQLQFRKQTPLIPADLRFEVGERMDAKGQVLRPLDLAELEPIAQELKNRGIEALAISFLNAYLNPAHERAAAAWFSRNMPGLYVTAGTDLSREWFEYERTSTAVANAYVGPGWGRYMEDFLGGLDGAGCAAKIHMMASNGGVLTPGQAKAQPIALIESGPVGGCIGAGAFAKALGLGRIVAFDMGGTTAKCALIEEGGFEVLPTYYIGGYARGFPVRSAVLDIAEVGAGGGSIVSVSEQKRLVVGPRSAGARPGPAGFGLGGTEPTVTDADLVLGRIGPGAFLDGALRLDAAAARRAIADKVAGPLGYSMDDAAIATVAAGILDIAALAMSTAIKEVTVERGKDLRDFALFAFGGGGPLHAAKLARELHIPLIVIPTRPGNFSALGMLLAGARIDQTRTFLADPDAAAISEAGVIFAEMEEAAGATLGREFGAGQVIHRRFADLRYKGQKHSLRLPFGPSPDAGSLRAAFDAEYARRFGHADPRGAVELVSLAITAQAAGEQPDMAHLGRAEAARADVEPGRRPVYFAELGAYAETPVYRRESLARGFTGAGPAIIEEYGSTTVIGPADRLEIGDMLEIRIHCGSPAG